MCNGHWCIVSMADNVTLDRMDMHYKGKDKMGRSLDWKSGAGCMAVSSFRLKEM